MTPCHFVSVAILVLRVSGLLAGDAGCDPAKIIAKNGSPEELFAVSAAVAAGIVVAGAEYDAEMGDSAGAVYVFELEEGTWVQQKLLADDGATGDLFGTSVATDGGRTILLGASLDDDNGDRSGSAYFFERQPDESWAESAKIVASDGGRDDLFGIEVAVQGGRGFVGARDTGFAGAVYLFEERGSEWVETQVLTPQDATRGAAFGTALAVDGDSLVVGARSDAERGTATGAAFVFEREEDGTWVQTAKLVAEDADRVDSAGEAVAIDGDVIVVGAKGHDGDTDGGGVRSCTSGTKRVSGLRWRLSDRMTCVRGTDWAKPSRCWAT